MTADVVALALSGQPVVVTSFDEWRSAARNLIVRHVPPEYVQWIGQEGGGDLLSAMPPMAAGELVNDSVVEVAVEAESAVAVEGDVEGEVESAVEAEVPAVTESAGVSASKLASEETHNPDERSDPPPPNPPPGAPPRISRQLMEMLQGAACYRAHDRWAFLYRVLWRWHRGAHDVISMADVDGARLHHMVRAVRHEEHDMHAYLRFRERPEDAGAPRFVAWFEPAHDVLPQVAQHFARRMGKTSWMIATPEATVLWDGATLHTGEALARSAADFADAGEALWLTYYRSIFNPARLNADIMHGHIRQRFWKNLPEAAVVPHMVTQAAAGARKVGQLDSVGRRGGTTIPIAPEKAAPERQQPSSLDDCRRCELWQNATQAVAGQGARHAKIMLVGEQPGDQEDLAGKPFVGPAGQVLDAAVPPAGGPRTGKSPREW
jgi:DNA polymerase